MANLPIYGFATVEFMKIEWRANGLWSSILTQYFPPKLAINSFMISPQAYANPTITQGSAADLAVTQWGFNGNDLALKPVLYYEGKGGNATETLNTARGQLQDRLLRAPIQPGQHCWAVAAKGLKVKFWRWDPHKAEARRMEPVELARGP